MFTLYNADETRFLDNGLLEIDDIITDCKVEFGINKPFICNLTMFKDNLEKYKMVEGEKIILLPTPTGRQPFRIVDISPVDDFELNVFCRHVFHDLSKRTVNRCKVDEGNGAFILNKYKNSLDKAVPHIFTSNIASQTSLDWVRKKGLDCLLGDDENSFLSRLGGELEVNGFNVAINTRIGTDRGFTAMYRKNITGFNGKISLDGLITRILPVGFDGITLTELYVDSPLVNKYNDIYSEIIEFSEVKWKGSANNHSEEGFDTLEQAQAELKRLAKQYYLDTKCDVVQANFDINIALLQETEEYKDTAILEQLFLGDDIEIDFEPFNINLNKRMVYYTYDSLLQRYESVQIGEGEDNFLKDINNKIDKLPSREEVESGLQNAIDQAFKNVNNLIGSGGNNSYIKFIPNILNPREIVACDNEDLAKAVYCVRFNKAGIGVSTTGFNGVYQGLVTEGKFAINEITCNAFTAALIKTGMLSDATGKTWINMDNGTFNFNDNIYFDGNKFGLTAENTIIDKSGFTVKNGAITIKDNIDKDVLKGDVAGNLFLGGSLITKGQGISQRGIMISGSGAFIYDWAEYGHIDPIGLLSSGRLTISGRSVPETLLANEKYSALSLSYKGTDGLYYPYVRFDNDKMVNTQQPIEFLRTTRFWDRVNSDLSFTAPTVYTNFIGSTLAYDNSLFMQSQGGGWVANRNFYVNGQLIVAGSKTRAVDTKFGTTSQNAYETAECLFGDVGEGTIGKDGLCYIYIDPIMLETINTKCAYQVFLQAYGEGSIYPIERNEDNFIIKGTPGLKFAWELKAKQRGYENSRLEMVDKKEDTTEAKNDFEEYEKDVDCENLSINYLQKYEEELKNGY